ncbi:MAG: oligosaccharide flippase family protein [Gallionella sp.]|jgi:O-antigen/teichoic acid export membrane protein
MSNLKQRAIKASIWTIGSHVASQGIRLATNLIMTRLLVPEMFGVMAIVTVVIVGLALFTDLGLSQSIIQNKRGDDPVFLNTVWSVQIIRGIIIWIVSILISIALYEAGELGFLVSNTVYADPLLPWIIPVVSLSVLFAAFEPTWTSTASRRLEQAKITMIELSSQIVSILVMLVWVSLDKSIWALVAGSLSVSIVRNFIVYYVVPGESNKWELEREAVKEILHFGKWIFASSIVGFLFMNGDRLLLGGLITAPELGVYTIAFFIVSSISQITGRLFGNVAFPVLSEADRSRPGQLINVYYRFRFLFDIGLLFFAGFFFETGSLIIRILYDSRYVNAGHMLEILSLTLIAVRYNLTDQCFIAIGKPKLMTFLIVTRAISLFVFLPIAFNKYQMTGALWAIVASNFMSIPLTLYFKYKLKLLSFNKEIYTAPALILGGVVGMLTMNVFHIVSK